MISMNFLIKPVWNTSDILNKKEWKICAIESNLEISESGKY